MIKVLLIIPDRDLQGKSEAYLANIDIPEVIIENTHIYGTHNASTLKTDADIVIARGITAQAIKRSNPDIYIVEITVTSDDIIHALVESVRKNGKQHTALVLSSSNNCRIDLLEEISGIRIQPYYISDETEIKPIIDDILRRDIRSIIGGLTVCEYCQQLGLPYVKIRTGEEAIKRAINEALNTAQSLNHEKAKTNLLRTLLNNNRDALIAVDSAGKVIDMNIQAQYLFNISEQRAPLYIHEFLSDSDWAKTLQTREHSEQLQTIANKLMLVSRAPILVDSHQVGVLLTFQSTDDIRETEGRVRKQLSKKGLVANYTFDDIMAVSPNMQQRIQTGKKYSAVESNVLIVGETGTGKELFAQSIHNASCRKRQPFVAINCAALPEQLLESELFGYTEGSFSGASRGGKIGLFEQAHKGTIFLDEIGEMPISLQAKLLRVLEEKEIRRIGDNKVIPVDIRIICATNINIQEKIKNGLFRPDLFYRINTLSLQIPPLRERIEDIEAIFRYYVKYYAQKANQPIPALTDDAIALLKSYDWPGNVRELKNFSERIMILGDGNIIDSASIASARLLDEPNGKIAQKTSNDFDTIDTDEELAIKLFKYSNITKAELAKQLGISRTTLWRRMKSK